MPYVCGGRIPSRPYQIQQGWSEYLGGESLGVESDHSLVLSCCVLACLGLGVFVGYG